MIELLRLYICNTNVYSYKEKDGHVTEEISWAKSRSEGMSWAKSRSEGMSWAKPRSEGMSWAKPRS